MTFDLAIEAVAHSAPNGWLVEEFRRHATLVDEVKADSDMPLLSLASTGVVSPRIEEGGMGKQIPSKSTIQRYWIARPGNLVVNPMWLVGGGIGVSQVTGAVSPDYRVYKLGSKLFPPFIHHLLRSQPYRDQYRLYMRAETTFDRRVSKLNFHPMPLLIPPLEEQRRIADFLDSETARIDRLDMLQREALELLGERELAIRDGLVNGLAQKIGEVPLRRFITRIDQGESPQCEAFPREDDEWGVLKLSAIKSGRFNAKENKRLPSGEEPRIEYEIRPGDLLVTRANTPQLVGDVAVAYGKVQGLLLPDLIYRISLTSDVSPEYVAQVALSGRVRSLIQSTARGSSQSMVKLRGEDIREWLIPAATSTQQESLVREINQCTSVIERAANTIRRQLDLLAERRQTLISAAVTGQLDVTTARRTTAQLS
ncbi:hypothetical protein ABZ547_28240 [Streptomyces sparsogenes]|uniref:hypothetical protein n=1 Tax=Streptomyces sparsogenes TaxID=67365 RepID=UPI003409A2BC